MSESMELLIQGVQISLIGMGVVFIALTIISWILSYFDQVDHLLTRSQKPPLAEEMPTPAIMPFPEGAISPEIIAAISAAVAVAIEQKVQIKHIHYRRQPADITWAVQGRATIMASHSIKPKN